MKKILISLCLTSLLWSPTGFGHPDPGSACEPPLRPVNDQDDALWQRFLDEIDGFRECTQQRMAYHQEAAADHQRRARDSVAHWNQFVRGSLNAPKDFPWPPEEAE